MPIGYVAHRTEEVAPHRRNRMAGGSCCYCQAGVLVNPQTFDEAEQSARQCGDRIIVLCTECAEAIDREQLTVRAVTAHGQRMAQQATEDRAKNLQN